MSKKTYLTTLLIAMTLSALANADWASDMFKDTSHNFGMVARGADTRFSFVFTNKYQEDVVIESVQSTCRCTQPSFQKRVIKTWETGQIDIQLDTRNFYGRKDATVTVRFSKPYYAEVQLHSFCFIRTDVYVEPGIVAFGTVQQGQPRMARFRVNYAGRTYWQSWAIRDIQSESSFYKATLKEVQRDYNYVSYDITLTLKENAPEGYLNDFIDIISNDPNPSNQHCPVPVSGYIIPSVAVKPSPLSFGTIKAGQSLTKTVVLSGQSQFKITEFGTSDDRVSAQISDAQKSVHVIPVTITNNGKGGKVTGTLAFRVSSQSNVVNLPFSAELEQGTPATPPLETPEATPEVKKSDDVPAAPTQKAAKSKPAESQQPAEVQQPAETQQPRELTPAEEYFPANPVTEPEDVPAISEQAPVQQAAPVKETTPAASETKPAQPKASAAQSAAEEKIVPPPVNDAEEDVDEVVAPDVDANGEVELPPAPSNY
ncbi:MAG: DUF1573 domain-containing protein [Thermoguttaceae bacterium]|nr:DUF1573 domain-containing protein [Thermoguttaceae bacterium]